MPVDPLGIGDVNEPCEVDTELGELLKSLGFDPGVPIYRATPMDPFETVFEQIREGVYRGLVISEFEPALLAWFTRDRRHGGHAVRVLIELLQAVHKPFRIAEDGPIATQSDSFRDPDWYVRGLIPHHGHMPPKGRFHAYIQTEPGKWAHGWPHGMIVQIVKEPTGTDKNAPLIWGIGIPDGLVSS
jgi:hypothetical protein